MRILISFLLMSLPCITMAQRNCASHHYLQQEMIANPALKAGLIAQEKFIQQKINTPTVISGVEGSSPSSTIIRIPVVFHILYNNPYQNINDQQIISQLKVLNEDFRRKNKDNINTPSIFRQLAADCQLEFFLATRDPSGRPTNGILRKKTSIQVFGMDDRIKVSKNGGDDAWDADEYLNIWIGNLAGGLVGYSSPLGGPADKDGVVLRFDAVGLGGSARAPFDKGRTATHEIGHWLGLQHIWGDEFCGNDMVDDTPPQQSASHGCPTGMVSSCNNQGNMYMNFMDLTNDECMNMFTVGQRQRIRVLFEPGGPRNALLFSQGLTAPELSQVPGELPVEQDPKVLVLFPNPVSNTLTIRFPGDLSAQTLFVYNPSGQLVRKMHCLGQSITMNVSSLPSGQYIIRTLPSMQMLRFIKS